MNTAKAIALCCFSAATLFLFGDRSIAQESCRVADPTNTPLNVRTEPNGRVVATLRNGEAVSILNRSIDQRGRNWVYIREINQSVPLGWAFSDFIRCSSAEFTPVENLYRAWKTLDINLYAAQWAPNAYKIDHKRGIKIDSARLFAERENLFSQIATADAEYTPVLENSNGDEALIRVSYSLKITYKSGRGFTQKDCETYRVRKFGNRWLIVTNDDYLPCASAPPSASQKSDQAPQKNTQFEIVDSKIATPTNQKAVDAPVEKSEKVDVSFFYFLLALTILFLFALLIRFVRSRANSAATTLSSNVTRSQKRVKNTKQTTIRSPKLSPSDSEVGLEQALGRDNNKSSAGKNRGASIRKSDQVTSIDEVRIPIRVSSADSASQENKPARNPSAKSSGGNVKGVGSVISNKVFLLVVGVLILCSVVFAYVVTPRDDCAWLENLDQDRLKQRIALLPLDRRFEVGQKIMMLGYGELGEALDSTRKRMEALERGEQYERKNLSFEETKKLACTRVREIVEPIYNWR